MPSTYSTRLRLELQGAGENANTWGDKANTVFRRLEESITGVLPLNVGTSVSSAIALTYNNGSSDQARYAYLNVTGQLASSVPIQVSAIDKSYWINNQTTGAPLLFGVVGRANVTVPSGWAHIVTDGSASWVAAAPVSIPPAQTFLTEASASSAFAFKGLANTFLSQQNFQGAINVSGVATFASTLSQRGPITSPPSFELYTTEPAFVSATAGALSFAVQDLVGTKTAAGGIRMLVESAQAASVQTRLDIITKASNGSPGPVLHASRGLWTPGVSGADKGFGSINAAALFVEGVPVLTSATLPGLGLVSVTTTGGGTNILFGQNSSVATFYSFAAESMVSGAGTYTRITGFGLVQVGNMLVFRLYGTNFDPSGGGGT